MKIIGCDFHPGYQQIAMWDQATGEMLEKALGHERNDGAVVADVLAGAMMEQRRRPG